MVEHRGVLHAHTTWSDGEYTLAELRAALLREGYSFACTNEHAELIEEARVEEYRRACEALSDERFVFVPGLEYECERRMHVLGVGCTVPAGSQDPQRVIARIRAAGCTAVIAHPRDDMFAWIESFAELPDGIEAWNSKYDGAYAPRPGTFALVQRLRARDGRLRAHYGVDLHFRKQNRRLHLRLASPRLDAEAILAALREGRYAGRMGEVSLPADGVLAPAQLERFGRTSARYLAFKRLTSGVKKRLDRAGLTIPAGLKSQLRRLF